MNLLKNIFGKKKEFKAVAISIARNEELFIAEHIRHLASQGLELILIDNGSTDRTKEIASSYLGQGVCSIIDVPYTGTFNLKYLLGKVTDIVCETQADWFIYLNPDEFPLPVKPYSTLKEAFQQVQNQGYNAINFDEFVFLPEDDHVSYEGSDFLTNMKHYYFFEPSPLHRVIAWKSHPKVELIQSGGHKVEFPGLKIYPTSFAFRHYVFLSRLHAMSKYGNRLFSREGISSGWHKHRVSVKASEIILPPLSSLKKMKTDDDFDRTDPRKQHLFFNLNTSFSKYKEKYFYKYTLAVEKSDGIEGAGAFRAVPFLVGFPGDGIRTIRSLLEPYFTFIAPEKDTLIPKLLLEDDIHTAEHFIRMVHDSGFAEELGIRFEALNDAISELPSYDPIEAFRLIYGSYASENHRELAGNAAPGNYLWIAGIQRLMPEAHFIHIVEDVRDVLARRKAAGTLSLKEIEEITSEWMMSVVEAKQQSQFCRYYLVIKFEDFIADPASQAHRLIEFLNLKVAENELNDNIRVLQGQIAFQSGNRNQRHLLTPEEIALIESIAGLTLNDSGYK